MKRKIILIFIFVLILTGCNETTKKEEKKIENDKTFYENGKVIYFNPEKNEKCSSSEVVSAGNSGCLKWYAINDEEGMETLNMILDHNTTDKAAYTGGEDLYGTTSTSADNQLKLDTKKWSKKIKVRNISIKDIEKLLNITFEQKSLYLETGNQTKPTSYEKYSWLYENTNGCTKYGCTTENKDTLGYWTIDSAMNGENATLNAWVITGSGTVGYNKKNIASRYGVRPIIEVSKNNIK